MMKKNLFLLLLSSFCLFFACKKEPITGARGTNINISSTVLHYETHQPIEGVSLILNRWFKLNDFFSNDENLPATKATTNSKGNASFTFFAKDSVIRLRIKCVENVGIFRKKFNKAFIGSPC